MARKPSSVFVLLEHPNVTSTPNPQLPPTSLQAWRVPLRDGETVEELVERTYEQHPIGSTVIAVEDTKVSAYTVGVELTEVEDVRLEVESPE